MMTKWAVDVMSGDPFEGTTMYFYADNAEFLYPVEDRRVGDKAKMSISCDLEITANGAKFNFGIRHGEGCFRELRKGGVNE